ncbi:MAG: hypothetical protein AAF798_13725 [Bacteroidota bacterium]
MLNRIRAVWELSQVYGLECYLDGHQKEAYYLVQVVKKGSQATITSTQHFDNWETLLGAIDPTIPVALVFNGRGIITKPLKTNAMDWVELAQEALPNANAEDLVGQVFDEGTERQLSLLRKSVANDKIAMLEASKIKVIALAVGAWNAAWIAPFLSTSNSSIPLRNQRIALADGALPKLLPNAGSEQVSIGDQTIDSGFLLAFSIALKVLLKVPSLTYNSDQINENYNNALLVQRTNVAFISGGVFLLVLALLNFFAFMYLREAVASGGVQTYQYQQQLDQIKALEQEIQRKQQLAGNNSVLAPSKVSFYADEIAWTMPSGIKLIKLNIFPKKADLKRQEENYQFEKGIITIEGQTRKSANLNLWIKQLESLDWVEKVKVLPYKEDRTGLGTFELVLQLRP